LPAVVVAGAMAIPLAQVGRMAAAAGLMRTLTGLPVTPTLNGFFGLLLLCSSSWITSFTMDYTRLTTCPELMVGINNQCNAQVSSALSEFFCRE
jgi:hypothetical protein